LKDLIGFVGLGIMGNPMSQNLIRKGCNLLVNDVDPQAQEKMQKAGATPASLSEIGEKCGIIFTMLPTGKIVQDVLFAARGVASTIKPKSLVVDMSSVTPEEAKYNYTELKILGVDFIDAPVSGGEPKAVDGSLVFMVGGDEAAFNRAFPYFKMMGSQAVLIGKAGSGCIAKLANQIIVNLTIAAVSEALVFSKKAGVDPGKVYEAIRGGLAGSVVLDAKAPMMLAHNFNPGGKVSINLKDIKNVMATAHSIDSPVPLSSQLLEIMQSLKVHGHSNDDHSGIVQYFEQLSNIRLNEV
jgi:2-hydroxy-3-oxopropionate reductase